jgi:Ca2+-binding RTX toxin-like protein
VLEGRGGADALTGGAGSDRFVYAADALGAADVIADWGPTDRLDVSQLLASLAAAAGDPAPVGTDYVKFVQNGADVEVRVDQNGGQAGDSATLLAVVANATAADVQSRTDFS